MITPSLERLLLNGDAKFSNHVHFFSGISCLPVKEGSLVIITGFSYFPFFNSEPTRNLPDVMKKNITQFRMYTQKQHIHWLLKSFFKLITRYGAGNNDPQNFYYQAEAAHYKYDCFVVAEKDVFFDICYMSEFKFNGNDITAGQLPASCATPPLISAGNAAETGGVYALNMQVQSNSDAGIYNFITEKYRSGITPGITTYLSENNEIPSNLSSGNMLNTLSAYYKTSDDTDKFPVVNVEYVEIVNKGKFSALFGGNNH